MSYLAFALKYRPQNFDQVVGQEHIVSSLKKAISSKRVHHAYLFSGPRGVGKTSLARILAKSINCLEGPTADPCLRCPSCLDIASGKSLDIIEIDGASNRGIDEIRSLRENIKLSPASARFKVYIIDEVHMLTKEAFNALLKTLEEPPSHIKFIFATTDPHKVLPTILSRCQKFQFNLLSLNQIMGKLKKIAAAESLAVDDSILYAIAQAAEGSIRDAESFFDQVFPVISDGKGIKDIFSFLGIIDEASLNKLISFLADDDISGSLEFIDQMKKEGKDLGVFIDYFLKYLRNLLMAQINPLKFKEIAEISPQSRDFLTDIAACFSLSKTLKLIDLLIKAKETSKYINSVHIPFELVLVKLICKDNSFKDSKQIKRKVEPEKNPGINRQEVKKENNPPPKKKLFSQPEKRADLAEGKEKEAFIDKKETEIEKKPQVEKEEKNIDDILIQPVKIKWEEILSNMQKKRMAIASHLSFGRADSSSGKEIFIVFSSQDKFHKEALDSEKSRKFIEESIKSVIEKDVVVKFKIVKSEEKISTDAGTSEGKEHRARKEKEDDDFLNDLLNTFDGKFHSDE